MTRTSDERRRTLTELDTSRRNLIAGIAAVGVAVPVLAACGSDATDSTASTGSTDATGSSTPGATTSSGSTADAGAIKTAEIPVGGGKIFTDEKIVVTQPAAGEFKAFSAVCPHQGCILAKVADGTIDCSACHGSEFSIEDGSVEQGPATKGLTKKSVTVSGDSLTVS